MEHEQMGFSDKPSLEDILNGLRGKKEFDDKLSYLLEALRKYEGLGEKLNLIDRIPKAKEGVEIRIKAAQEVLKEPLGNKKFSDLYSICQLGSKEKYPDGYHVYVQEGKTVPINPEIVPHDLAGDLLNWSLVLCYYHYVGFITGAIARNKPYELLQFNPSLELQQLIENATQEYKIVIRQNPARNYKIKPEEDIVTGVIFEDAEFYADASKRKEVVGYLHELNTAVHDYKQLRISKEHLDEIARKMPLRQKPVKHTIVAEDVATAAAAEQGIVPETRQLEEKVEQEGVSYGLPHIGSLNFEFINGALAAYRKSVPHDGVPYEITPVGQSGAAIIHFHKKEISENELEEAARYVKWLDTVTGQIRAGKQDYELPYALAEGRTEDINLLITTFNQRYELHHDVPEGENAKVRFYEGELSQKEILQSLLKVQEGAIRVQKLDIIVGILKKDPSKVAEVMPNIYRALGQQPK